MRFGLIHRIMTDALAVLGLLALVTSGELEQWMTILIVVGAAAALTIPERWQDKAWLRQAGNYAPVVLLVAQLARLAMGGEVLQLAVEFASALQVVRLATRRGAAHDQQVIVLALLHLIAGTVLGGGLAYGLCFLGFLVVAPGALVLSHLRREVEGNYRQGARDRTGLPVDVPRILRSRRVIGKQFLVFTCMLSVPIFLFTAVLFVLFPRVGLSLLLLNHSRPERMIGFSDRVDLGGVGKLRSDPTIAMRVEYGDMPAGDPPARLAMYLRGTAFDRYDGGSWARTDVNRRPASRRGRDVEIRRFPDPARDRTMTIDLEPIDPPVLFLPPRAAAITLLNRGEPLLGIPPTVFVGPEGELKYATSDDRGIRYEVYLARPDEPPPRALTSDERIRYLAMPVDMPTRIGGLARTWAGSLEDPVAQAKVVELRLRTDYSYDLESPSGAAPNPLDHFLFESKRGHCEFYSTAMAMMLRSLGIPSRNVTGFIGGTYNRFGKFYAVRQGDAHSWVEAYLPDRGWTRFDPTPPGDAAPRSEISGVLAFVRDVLEAAAQRWNRHIIGYDLKQQIQILRSFNRDTDVPGASKIFNAITSSPRRAAMLVGGVILIVLSIILWRRRKRGSGDPTDTKTAEEIAAIRVVELYRALEIALAMVGMPRPASTPPLRHARAVAAIGHPAGAEVLALTEIYIEVRFGQRLLSEAEHDDFVQRVKNIRMVRPEPQREAA